LGNPDSRPNRSPANPEPPGRCRGRSCENRAQVSIEYLLTLAIAMLAITAIVLIAQGHIDTVQKQKDNADVQNSLYDLTSAAKEVYAQGEGSRKQVLVQLPSGYEPEYSSVGNNSIRIRAYGTDYVSFEDFKVRGYLPETSGKHWVWVTSEGNRVRIGPAMMELSRNRIYIIMEQNATASSSFRLTNIWKNAIQVNATPFWTHPDVDMDGVPLTLSIDTNDSETIPLQFASGADAAGFYIGEIELRAGDGLGASETVIVPVTVYVIGYEPGYDLSGPPFNGMYNVPEPPIKNTPTAIYASASGELTGNSTIMSCSISADGAPWETMLPLDGAYDNPNETVYFDFTSGFPLGLHSIQARCTDSSNNTGPTAFYFFNVSEADQLGPIVIGMWNTAYPTTLSNVSVGGIATDEYTGNSNISGCLVQVDGGPWVHAAADDGAWDSPMENFSFNIGRMNVGYHEAFFQCNDSIGNAGGIYNVTFGIVDVDMMLVLDRSGSMDYTVTNSTSTSAVSTTNTGWTRLKNITVSEKNGALADLVAEIRASATNCTAFYEARINGVVVDGGNTTSTSYVTLNHSIDVSSFEEPYDVALYMKRMSGSSCTVYNRLLGLYQNPKKMEASKEAAKLFLDISGSATYAGLVSYSTSASLDRQLTVMTPSNQQALKDAIDSMAATGSTCIECGLEYGADELMSARGRPTSTRVIVLLTDGIGNVGDSINGGILQVAEYHGLYDRLRQRCGRH